jgi:hypothetical protein
MFFHFVKHVALAVPLLAASFGATLAADVETDLQLVLAVDASGSVNQSRFELQRKGYAAAFRHPEILRAIRSGAAQRIAVTMVQRTGPRLQVHVVPWMLIDGEASAEAFAAAVENAPRELFGGGTSISGAIDYGRALFPQTQYRGTRRVIDISGDGANNSGRPVHIARDEAVKAGIVINGLPILSLEPALDSYFFNNVIGGPGSFMIPSACYENFGEAIRRKLVIEIADRAPRFAADGEGAETIKRPEPGGSSAPGRRG